MYQPQSHQMRDGRWEPVPFKTSESFGLFVLHDHFAECGFIDWALKAPGPVFPMLMRAADPADAAQKRMKRLYERSGADPQRSSTFHGLRAGKIRNDRDLVLPARAVRLQVGHELTDVHERYDGQMLGDKMPASLTPAFEWIDGAQRQEEMTRFGRKPRVSLPDTSARKRTNTQEAYRP